MRVLLFTCILLSYFSGYAQCDGVKLEGLPSGICQWQELFPVVKLPSNFPKQAQIQWTASGGDLVEKIDMDKKQAQITPKSFLGELTITLIVSSEKCTGEVNTSKGPQIITRTLQVYPNPKVTPEPIRSCRIETCGYFNLFDAFPESVRGNIVGFWESEAFARKNIKNQKIQLSGNFSTGVNKELFARIEYSTDCSNIVPFTIEVLESPAGLEDEVDLSFVKKHNKEEIAELLGLTETASLSFHQSRGTAWNSQPNSSIDIESALFLTIKDTESGCISVLEINKHQ